MVGLATFENLRYLDSQSRDILLTWRVNRYTRNPFPDDFNRIFLGSYLHSTSSGLTSYLVSHRGDINDLYVYVAPDREGADEYAVSITILLTSQCSRENYLEIDAFMERQLHEMHRADDCLKMMQVDDRYIPQDLQHTLDRVVYPANFSMLDVQAMKRYTLDYLCFSL